MRRREAVLSCVVLASAALAWTWTNGEDHTRLAAPTELEAWAGSLIADSPDSESALMAGAILEGKLRPDTGWFKKPAQRKYDWSSITARYGVADDAAITRRSGEIPEDLFDSLDANADDKITSTDFDWSQDWSGAQLVLPPSDVLLESLRAGDIGSLTEGPNVGEPAPDFTLKTPDGETPLRLHEHLRRSKPVVLAFGSFTCGEFRGMASTLSAIFAEFKDKATFFGVYLREAHPADGWQIGAQQAPQMRIPQPTTYLERARVATQCRSWLNLPFVLLVDDLDDSVGRAYSGMPARLYVIAADGVITFKAARGPYGFRPKEMKQALALTLLDAR